MTATQNDQIARLIRERDCNGLSNEQQEFLRRVRFEGVVLTESQADRVIAKLLTLRVIAAPAARVEVAAGRYAIEIDGTVHFFRVDRPEKGKWNGWTFVKEQASDDFYPVRGERAKTVLAAIAVDPAAAMIRYGHELGQCGNCGRTLTDEISREMGIGPECAKHLGIERPGKAAPAAAPAVAPSSDHFVDQERDLAAAREQTTAAPTQEPIEKVSYPGLRAAAGRVDPAKAVGWRERKAAVAEQQADGGSSRERYAAISAKSGRVHTGELPGSTWEDIFNMGAGV